MKKLTITVESAGAGPYVLRDGTVLTDEDIEAIADELASPDYQPTNARVIWHRGRPSLGSGPSKTVPVRLDPELHEALRARAEFDHTTSSDVVRTALRQYLAD